MNPLGKPHGSIGKSPATGITSPAYWVLRCNDSYNPKYLHYVLRSELMINEFKRKSKNLPPNQFDLPWEQFREIEFNFPSINEQISIVSKLDEKVLAIDKSISMINNLYNKLKEMRDSLSNSFFPFDRETDISNLGNQKIPVEWKCIPLGRMGKRISHSGFPDLEPLSVYLNVGVIPRSSRSDNKNQLGSDMSKYQKVLDGDLIFNKLRTWQGGFGVAKQTGIVSPAYYVFRFDNEKIIPEYVDLLLKSPLYLAAITRVTKWMPPSQFDTSWEDLKAIPIIFPNIKEQQAILEKSRILESIKTAEAKLHNLIDLYNQLGRSLVHMFITKGEIIENVKSNA
jgi:type I restriction enzyme S subunit